MRWSIEAMSSGFALVAMDCPRGPARIVARRQERLPGRGRRRHRRSPRRCLALVEDDELRRRCGRQALADAHTLRPERVTAEWLSLLENLDHFELARRGHRRSRGVQRGRSASEHEPARVRPRRGPEERYDVPATCLADNRKALRDAGVLYPGGHDRMFLGAVDVRGTHQAWGRSAARWPGRGTTCAVGPAPTTGPTVLSHELLAAAPSARSRERSACSRTSRRTSWSPLATPRGRRPPSGRRASSTAAALVRGLPRPGP